jgi:hypothetical protein
MERPRFHGSAMLSKRAAYSLRFLSVWLLICVVSSSMIRADIVRWDSGQVIPGTEGITPGPGVQLASRQLEYASLSFIDLTSANLSGANLSNARFDFSSLTSANLSGATVTGAEFSILRRAASLKSSSTRRPVTKKRSAGNRPWLLGYLWIGNSPVR